MPTIAIVNEKGGTAKTTTAVNLAAALGEMGKKVLLVDLDGQAASSRWLGVEEDNLLADAILRGHDLEPLENVIPGVSLAPASGKLDSVAHDLRPTQGGQLRKLLHEVSGNYDYILIDCPPSLGNRLIGNALLAASHAIAPVETSVLALDGLRILLTMLEDIRDGFGHDIQLIGVLACRYDERRRLSRLVLAELNRALPEKVFNTIIRENAQIQECPASGRSILGYAPDCTAAEDYRRLARELVAGPAVLPETGTADADLAADGELTSDEHLTVVDFRKQMGAIFGGDAQPEPDDMMPVLTPPTEGSADDYEIVSATVPPADSEPAPPIEEAQEAPVEQAELAPPVEVAEPAPPVEQAEPAPPVEVEHQTPVDQTPEPTPAPAAKPAEKKRIPPKPYRPRSSKVKRRIIEVAVVLLVVGAVLAARYAFEDEQAVPKQTRAQVTRPPRPAPRPAPPTTTDPPPKPPPVEPPAPPPIEPPVIVTVDPVTPPGLVDPPPPLPPRAAKIDVGPPPTEPPAEPTKGGETVAKKPPTPAAPAKTEPTPPKIERYQSCPPGFDLTCVLKSGGGRWAIINGRIVDVGQSIRGAKVIKIFPSAAELELDGKRFMLRIGGKKAPGGSSSSGRGKK